MHFALVILIQINGLLRHYILAKGAAGTQVHFYKQKHLLSVTSMAEVKAFSSLSFRQARFEHFRTLTVKQL